MIILIISVPYYYICFSISFMVDQIFDSNQNLLSIHLLSIYFVLDTVSQIQNEKYHDILKYMPA